ARTAAELLSTRSQRLIPQLNTPFTNSEKTTPMKANPLKTYTEQEIQQRILKFEYWEYNEGYLVTSLDFKNFADAFATMTRIAFEAERLNHHPDWSNTYNNLSIQLRTHDSNGITDKDFELAAQIEKIIQGS